MNEDALTVEEIAAMRSKIAPGEWHVEAVSYGTQQEYEIVDADRTCRLAHVYTKPCAEFFAAAPQAIDFLLAEVARLQAQVERAVSGLEAAMSFGFPDGNGDGEPGQYDADRAATAARDALADMARLKGAGK